MGAHREQLREVYREMARNKRAAALPQSVNVQVPASVLAERDRALATPRTPNMEILGDPIPGRGFLDRRRQ